MPDDVAAGDPDATRRLTAIRAAFNRRPHAALCLSGGGIRSASVAMGVLQGLAHFRLLGAFDYLSTVSGGGYTGGWLSAWLTNAASRGVPPEQVFDCLGGLHASADRPEPEPLQRVREYSHYLDPQIGLFSVDVWTLVATVLRNMLLNWLVLAPLLAAGLLLPRLYYSLTDLGSQYWLDRDDLAAWSTVFGVGGCVLVAIALVYIVANLPSIGNRRSGQGAFLAGCLGPLVAATAVFTLYWAWSRELDADPVPTRALVLLGLTLHTAVWIVASLLRWPRVRPWTWVAAALSGGLAGLGAAWFGLHPFADPLARGPLFAAVGVPLMLGIVGGAGTLFIGIASRETRDEDREWWSRFGAWLLITAVSWMAVSTIVFVGPRFLRGTVAMLAGWLHMSTAQTNGLMGLLTALVGGVSALAGREREGIQDSWMRRAVFALAAPAFVLLLLIVIATANVALLDQLHTSGLWTTYIHPEGAGLFDILALAGGLIAIGLVMGWFVAVNRFSLHGMYRNRLIRAFLGASRSQTERRPNRFTGFDPKDNLPLSALTRIRRPLHVVNMTLNLVADTRLAWQERKAASFTASPLFAGSAEGYRPVRSYGGPDGLSLGTAITISGAAASPNMGSHSSPALTFLLTLFNARLGIWLGNTGAAGRTTWQRREPWLGAGPLIREMFGRTTDANPYVYLSDGGHFENLGLYEMVARRCQVIVVSDAGCDPQYQFEDLGNAIRKIRIDFGIPIVFPGGLDQCAVTKATLAKHHGAIGLIDYRAVDGQHAENGVLVYVKATLTGDEPADVKNYAAVHTAFPHESTANQWFGESQFESYRELGRHAIETLSAGFTGTAGLAEFVARVAANVNAARVLEETTFAQPTSIVPRPAQPLGGAAEQSG